jgi:hypothetical protein
MLISKQDLALVKGVVNTQDKQEVIIRLFASALISGTTITAPEMRSVIQILTNSIVEQETGGEIKRQNSAE